MLLARFGGERAAESATSGRVSSSVAVCVFALFAQNVYGSAFSIAELGARAAGMGNAFTSVADDASAVFYNPAGLAFQEGMQFQMDGLVVVGLFRFVPSDPLPGTVVPEKGFHGSIKPKFIPVASLYMSKQISRKVTFGFGLFTPFGLSANFTNFNDGDPANTKFTGRWSGTRVRLEQFWFQPTLAYRVTPKMSVAAGVALVHTHLSIESSFLNPLDDALEFGREAAADVFPGVDKELAARSIARLLPEGRSRIAGTANAPGFNLGWLYKGDKWNFGFNFRSSVVSHLKGKASFAFGQNFALEKFLDEGQLYKAFPNQPIRGLFTTPATYAFGVSRPGPMNSLISFDAKLQDYRRFASVPLNFTVTRATNDDARTPAEQRLVFDFRNSWIMSAGMEKPMMKGKIVMRAGYAYDYSPVVDKSVGPLFPDANRHSFTIGGTKKVGNKDMTLFYEAMQFRNRTTNVPQNVIKGTNGEYRNFAHVFGMGLRLRPKK